MNSSLWSKEIKALSNLTWKKGKELSNYLERLIIWDQNNNFLNEYRWALSLWAEHTNDTKHKVIVTLDGRDTAGKGSNIRRVTEYFDLKRFDKKAYPVPTAEEKKWYNWFNRYSKDFPEPWKVIFFDRSWYNRAWVEAAMWFCTEEEYNWFMQNVSQFEKDQIIDEWISFIKVYLSVTKKTQVLRLKWRNTNMKNWKSSIIDSKAQEKWNYYTLAKAKILEMTDSEHAPWMVLDSNEKHLSSVEIIKAMIKTVGEVAKLVENKLSIDLSPNKSIVRTAKEELLRMKEDWSIKNMKKRFNFAKPKI
jgi:polyphosphate kinase